MMLPTILIAIVCVLAPLVALARTKDTLHPSVILAPMFAFLYAYLPYTIDDDDGFRGLLTQDQLEFVQWINAASVAAFFVGLSIAGRGAGGIPAADPEPQVRERLRWAALAFGAFGVGTFIITIVNVGGISRAYGQAYGGGWSDSGYIRDGMLLTVPALVLIGTLWRERWSLKMWGFVVLFASPLLVQAILGARRGPTFMAAAAIGVAYYLGRRARPRILTLAVGGAVVGSLMLFLVSNRQNIYVGSEAVLDAEFRPVLSGHSGNEYVYGAGTIVHYDQTSNHTWGGRYFTVFFIRPIPRAVWPDKYGFASRLFGIPSLEYNLGIDAASFQQTLGWKGAQGAAPGIVADMFVELRYGCVFALFLLGYGFGFVWKRAATVGGVWVVIYALAIAVSIYLVMQTLEAMAFRFLLTALPTVLAWRLSHRNSRPLMTSPKREPVAA